MCEILMILYILYIYIYFEHKLVYLVYPFILIPHYIGETAQYKLIPKFFQTKSEIKNRYTIVFSTHVHFQRYL